MKSIRLHALPALLLCAGLVSGCGDSGMPGSIGIPAPIDAAPTPTPTKSLSLAVLSNRADLISGGDALVEVVLPTGIEVSAVRVSVAGRDVTNQFALRANGRYQGVVTGLALGENVLTATLPGATGAAITITNHPSGGPVFSGPQIEPWYCQAGATDKQCSRPVVYDYVYKSAVTNNFAAYDPANPPPDLATVTNDQGTTVPYIVRRETGSMDRSEYLIAVLADPAAPFDRWSGPKGWNHKVYVLHGGGCAGKRTAGIAPDVLDEGPLSRGFLTISTALEDSNQNCNVVVQSESVMMAKEYVIENYGDVRYVMGVGSSGGSLASLQMSNAYPGLYDGLIVGATFPDLTYNDLIDCLQMHRYFDNPTRWAPGVVWAEPLMAAAESKQTTSVCRLESLPFGPENYSNMFNPSDPAWCDMGAHEPERVYNASTNPEGVRCAIQDYMVNVLGTRAPEYWGPVEKGIKRGFANRPYDNVGVQYGLRALMAGTITAAHFVDLNVKIGATDIDYGTQAERVVAEPAGLIAAYRSGMVNSTNNLARLPIIDVPHPAGNADIHDKWKSFALRARLDAANGHHENHAIWLSSDREGAVVNAGAGFLTMDEWLTAIEQDDRSVPLEQKVREHKPALARDRCELPTPETCQTVQGPYGSVRFGAGSGIASDIMKCQLKPLDKADYGSVTFSDEQWSQFQVAFPGGVCDWSKPGIEQQHTLPWRNYMRGPGGADLPAAPASRPLP